MTGGTIKPEGYEALIKLRSVSEVAAYLKENTRYSRALSEVNTSLIHRGRLEELLKTQLINDILALAPFLHTSNRFFSEVFKLEDGIQKLKVFLGLLLIGAPEHFADYVQTIHTGSSVIDARELAEVKTFAEFMEFIRPTVYYKALSSFENDPERQQIFFLEIALDTFYTDLIFRYTKKYLSPSDAKVALKTYGAEVDLNNLTYILRSKANFKLSNEQLYACIIPKYYRLKQDMITELVNSSSYEDALEMIQAKTPYGSAFDKGDRFIEKRKNEYLYRQHRKLSMLQPYSIQTAIGYIAMRQYEIKNIVSIIEGIRYELTPDEIKEYLIGFGGEEAMT